MTRLVGRWDSDVRSELEIRFKSHQHCMVIEATGAGDIVQGEYAK